jgi:ClpP class serine protease
MFKQYYNYISCMYTSYYMIRYIYTLFKWKKRKPTLTEVCKKIEQLRDSKIIIINHAKKKSTYLNKMINGLTGDGDSGMISVRDMERFINIFNNIDENKQIDIILVTPGGSLTCTEAICNILSNHKGQVNVFVPKYCFSAGTMISLCADQIYLNHASQMGPIDPQFFVPANIIKNIAKHKKLADMNDITLGLYEESLKALNSVDSIARKCLRKNYSAEDIEIILGQLNGDKYLHGKCFDYNDLVNMKLKIKKDMPTDIKKLIKNHC